MTSDTTLILPVLPGNLESLRREEERIRTDSLLHLNADAKLKDHLNIVYDSLNVIHDLTIVYKKQTDDELTIQLLGIRLFNSTTSCLMLLLAGYCQCSAMLQRDILETGFLMGYFFVDRAKIREWKNCDPRQRYRKFQPGVIRKALDEHDGFVKSKRGPMYQLLCEYASHPTYPGFKLVSPKGQGKIGPFFDQRYLKAGIEELALRIPHFTLYYSRLFENLPRGFLKHQADFLDRLKTWGQKYIDPNFQSNVDTKYLKWMSELVS